MTRKNEQQPDVTIAGICEREGRILVVREYASGGVVLNLPGGHIEPGETPEQAVEREFIEETGVGFQPDFLLGCYVWDRPHDGKRYLRVVYSGSCTDPGAVPQAVNDPNIVTSTWMTADEIIAVTREHRYPIVARSIQDYLAGVRNPRRALRDYLPLPRNLDAVAEIGRAHV